MPAPARCAGARDHVVGALHGLDGDDGASLHHDRLADIEARYRVRHPIAEGEVVELVRRWRAPRQRTGPGEERLEEHGGIEKLDAIVPHDVRHRSGESIGVPGAEACEHGQQCQVGDDAREDLRVLDLPCHHRLRHAGAAQHRNALPQLPQREPVKVGAVAAGRVFELAKRLFLDGDDRHLVPHRTRRVEHEKRESAVAGDESDARHRRFTTPQSSETGPSGRRVARRSVTPRAEPRMNSTR